MPAPHPRMHGISHVAGGPDPVPGLLPGMSGAFDTVVVSLTDLVGYWRLGETGAPWRDTSGVAPAADLVLAGAGVALTAHVEGALSSGDDGAVNLNYDGHADGGGQYLASSGAKDFSLPELTVAAWAKVAASVDTRRGHIVGSIAAGAENLIGFGLQVIYPSLHIRFTTGGDILAESFVETSAGVVPGEWNFLAGTYDGTTMRLYVNGALLVEAAGGNASGDNPVLVGYAIRPTLPSLYTYDYLVGAVDEAAIWSRALEPTELGALYAAGITTTGATVEGAGPVLGLDENGHPAWVKPPMPTVTVNGSRPVAASTPKPTPPPPTTVTSPPDPLLDWIYDDPFTYNGGTFTVQPNTWTTIPFTTPLMERFSNASGVSAFAEIDLDDPAGGGWLHHDFPHGITIPHDFAFNGPAASGWGPQICLRIENPIVEGTTSRRALRVLETTHQKTLLSADGAAESVCAEGGGINVYRGPGLTVFAEGDTGGFHIGEHPDIFFTPNAGLANYYTGDDWLPKVDGVPTLKKGMRLVAQCWHNATVPLTFSCSPGSVYKPHFVLDANCDPAWGPPWSTWYP